LNEIATGVERAAAVMSTIAEAANSQTRDLADITAAVEQMGVVTQRTAANAEESAGAATEMSGQASDMYTMAAQFQLDESAAATPTRRVASFATPPSVRQRPVRTPAAPKAAAARPASSSFASEFPLDDDEASDVLSRF
jgi:methyl-accepting chemotaxis protein